MRGQYVSIPILGINNRTLSDQSRDGECDSIVNLKPRGTDEQPYWSPFEKINALKNEFATPFTYEFGLSSIVDAFWQVRNYIGEYSLDPEGSYKRLLVLCQNESRKAIDIIDPATWQVVKTQALPEQSGSFGMSCTRVDQVTIVNITKDKKPYLLYYLIDDAFIPQGWPEMPKITFATENLTFTPTEVDAGDTKGVQKEASDQWFLTTWAFRLFNGSYVKHDSFILTKVPSGANTEGITPKFTLAGYEESILVNEPFWSSLIAGIALCCTLPVNDEKQALDDGAFFEVGYWPWIDKLPISQWPTTEDPNILTVQLKSDAWPTQRPLGVDNFTHHRFSAKVVDTYNKRLLLGGSSVNFALPKIGTNASTNRIPAGVYSDYFAYHSGLFSRTDLYYDASGNPVGDQYGPDYSYEINQIDTSAKFNPKAGREFKTVDIEATSPESGNNNPPGGGSGFPTGDYTAMIVDGRLHFQTVTAETNYGSAGQFPSGQPFMDLKVTIGPIGGAADQVLFFKIRPAGNLAPFFTFSELQLELNEVVVIAKIYHIITIKTDQGTYQRIRTEDIIDGETAVTLPAQIWYPDKRAVKYELVVQNGTDFELALTKQLNQHPNSNYSYSILSTAEQSYTIGDSLILVDEPDLGKNLINQYVPNRIQASISGNPFIFDLAASYRVGNSENDTINGFGINVNRTNEGQAGQYPVYAFSDKGVWALEQTGDPNIAFGRITPITNFNGLNNPYAIANAGPVIIASDNKFIYSLAGLDSVRIDEAIANDPDYKDFLKQMRIGYHRALDYEEVIFSNPFYAYSLCYNIRYKVWYKATERFKFFFYDYPELMGMTVDNVLKDFSDKDTLSPVAWSMQTRPINFNEPWVYKRLFPSVIRMVMNQELKMTVAEYAPIKAELFGYRDSKTVTYKLREESIKTNTLYDYRIYNQMASMYAYRIKLEGSNYHQGSFIQLVDADVEYRYQETRRRLGCSAQYFYAMADASISICNGAGGGSDAHFVHTNLTGTLSEIVVHNLSKIPSVFVTDLEGYLIECGVQLIFDEGNPSLMRLRLTFEELIPYKAYFN